MTDDEARAFRKKAVSIAKRFSRSLDPEDLAHEMIINQLENKTTETTKLTWQLARAMRRFLGQKHSPNYELKKNAEIFPIEINEINQMPTKEHKHNIDYQKMLELLPSHMRAILNLLFIYEFELKEVAEIFGQHPTTIKNIYKRAERILRHEEALPQKTELRDWWKNP